MPPKAPNGPSIQQTTLDGHIQQDGNGTSVDADLENMTEDELRKELERLTNENAEQMATYKAQKIRRDDLLAQELNKSDQNQWDYELLQQIQKNDEALAEISGTREIFNSAWLLDSLLKKNTQLEAERQEFKKLRALYQEVVAIGRQEDRDLIATALAELKSLQAALSVSAENINSLESVRKQLALEETSNAQKDEKIRELQGEVEDLINELPSLKLQSQKTAGNLSEATDQSEPSGRLEDKESSPQDSQEYEAGANDDDFNISGELSIQDKDDVETSRVSLGSIANALQEDINMSDKSSASSDHAHSRCKLIPIESLRSDDENLVETFPDVYPKILQLAKMYVGQFDSTFGDWAKTNKRVKLPRCAHQVVAKRKTTWHNDIHSSSDTEDAIWKQDLGRACHDCISQHRLCLQTNKDWPDHITLLPSVEADSKASPLAREYWISSPSP